MVVILAKAPQRGRCKTRLTPRLGARGAAQLQAELLRKTVATALDSGHEVLVFATPNCKHPAFLRLRRQGVRIYRQQGRNLGLRMLSAARVALRQSPRVLILGTDCPAHTVDSLTTALAVDVPVLLPATDGGYVGLALSEASTAVFQRVNWGSAQVLAQTRRNFIRMQTPWQELPAKPDLDTPQDWRRQRASGVLTALASCRRC